MSLNTVSHRDLRPGVPSAAPREVLQIHGVVEHGDERGRTLGFPTANIGIPDLDLADGVWASTVQLDPNARGVGGCLHVAAVSIGHRPTYYGKHGTRLLEANLLDFSGDLYGRHVLVRLFIRLRPQRRFAGSSELIEQLHRDIDDTRAWAQVGGLGGLLQVPGEGAGARCGSSPIATGQVLGR